MSATNILQCSPSTPPNLKSPSKSSKKRAKRPTKKQCAEFNFKNVNVSVFNQKTTEKKAVPVRILIQCEPTVDCKQTSLILNELMSRIGLIVHFDVVHTFEDILFHSSFVHYDMIFINFEQILQMKMSIQLEDTFHLLLFRFILDYFDKIHEDTAIIGIGKKDHYVDALSLNMLTYFLDLPFNINRIVEVIMKYIFEVQETSFLCMSSESLPKTERIKYSIDQQIDFLKFNDVDSKPQYALGKIIETCTLDYVTPMMFGGYIPYTIGDHKRFSRKNEANTSEQPNLNDSCLFNMDSLDPQSTSFSQYITAFMNMSVKKEDLEFIQHYIWNDYCSSKEYDYSNRLSPYTLVNNHQSLFQLKQNLSSELDIIPRLRPTKKKDIFMDEWKNIFYVKNYTDNILFDQQYQFVYWYYDPSQVREYPLCNGMSCQAEPFMMEEILPPFESNALMSSETEPLCVEPLEREEYHSISLPSAPFPFEENSMVPEDCMPIKAAEPCPPNWMQMEEENQNWILEEEPQDKEWMDTQSIPELYAVEKFQFPLEEIPMEDCFPCEQVVNDSLSVEKQEETKTSSPPPFIEEMLKNMMQTYTTETSKESTTVLPESTDQGQPSEEVPPSRDQLYQALYEGVYQSAFITQLQQCWDLPPMEATIEDLFHWKWTHPNRNTSWSVQDPSVEKRSPPLCPTTARSNGLSWNQQKYKEKQQYIDTLVRIVVEMILYYYQKYPEGLPLEPLLAYYHEHHPPPPPSRGSSMDSFVPIAPRYDPMEVPQEVPKPAPRKSFYREAKKSKRDSTTEPKKSRSCPKKPYKRMS